MAEGECARLHLRLDGRGEVLQLLNLIVERLPLRRDHLEELPHEGLLSAAEDLDLAVGVHHPTLHVLDELLLSAVDVGGELAEHLAVPQAHLILRGSGGGFSATELSTWLRANAGRGG